ncbi:Reverse transcriptase zinc-binding domain [Sesbania bispinosa]|nr:Reverse transcriptase zinc-binding domain [Sesbania bispinosa]
MVPEPITTIMCAGDPTLHPCSMIVGRGVPLVMEYTQPSLLIIGCCPLMPTGMSEPWMWLWKLQGPEKVRFLIWLITHGSLPTNERRMRCGMTTSPACGRCSSLAEDINHCLRSYPHALEVWQRIGLHRDPGFNLVEVIPWIKTMCAGVNGSLFLAALWWQWRWRNNLALDDKKWSIEYVIRNIYISCDDFVHLLGPQEHTHPDIICCVKWTPPPTNTIKLNVDGSWFPSLTAWVLVVLLEMPTHLGYLVSLPFLALVLPLKLNYGRSIKGLLWLGIMAIDI